MKYTKQELTRSVIKSLNDLEKLESYLFIMKANQEAKEVNRLYNRGLFVASEITGTKRITTKHIFLVGQWKLCIGSMIDNLSTYYKFSNYSIC